MKYTAEWAELKAMLKSLKDHAWLKTHCEALLLFVSKVQKKATNIKKNYFVIYFTFKTAMQNISKVNQRCRTSILVANKKSTKRWYNQEQLDFPVCFVLTLLCVLFLNAMSEKCNLLNIF